MSMTLEKLARDLRWHANNACTLKDRERYVGWADAIDAHLTQPAQSVDVEKVREVIGDLREWGETDEQLAKRAKWLTAALQEKGNG